MGSVFKKTYTKPLPADAEIIVCKNQRIAKWRDARGKIRKAPIIIGTAGEERISLTSNTYTAKFRDGDGVVVELSTGCRDETAARRVLADLERRRELVKANVLTKAEDDAADYQTVSLSDHLIGYLDHLRSKGDSDRHIEDTERLIRRLMKDCDLVALRDIHRDVIEGWLAGRVKEKMAPRTRNSYLQAIGGFCGWCVETNRLTINPVSKIQRADEKVDRRRNRRALTEDELVRLLDVARRRPLEEAQTIRRGKNKGKLLANVRPETRLRLERLGWERALIYKMMALTGLRKNELSTLTVGQLLLDANFSYIELDAADEKSRKGNTIPIRADLADDLRTWLTAKLQVHQEAVISSGNVSNKLPPETLLFDVPTQLVKILNRDLKAAGIPKRDDRGWTVDVHALRHSFGTHLSIGGVSPRTAQAAMRHSKIDLTMNLYTDPILLDIHGALNALPELPLGGQCHQEVQERVEPTAHNESLAPLPTPSLAPVLAPNSDRACHLVSFSDKMTSMDKNDPTPPPVAVSVDGVNKKRPLSISDNRRFQRGRRDLNPQPPDRQSGTLTN